MYLYRSVPWKAIHDLFRLSSSVSGSLLLPHHAEEVHLQIVLYSYLKGSHPLPGRIPKSGNVFPALWNTVLSGGSAHNQTDSMLFRNIQCIPCQMWEIGRMLISSSNSTACPDRIICINLQFLTVLILCVNSPADSIFHNNVCHCSIFVNFHIRKLLHLCKQLTCNFFSCNILMEKDSRSGMGPFSCKCIALFLFPDFLLQQNYLPEHLTLSEIQHHIRSDPE